MAVEITKDASKNVGRTQSKPVKEDGHPSCKLWVDTDEELNRISTESVSSLSKFLLVISHLEVVLKNKYWPGLWTLQENKRPGESGQNWFLVNKR